MKKVRVVIAPNEKMTKEAEMTVVDIKFNNKKYPVAYDDKLKFCALIRPKSYTDKMIRDDMPIIADTINRYFGFEAREVYM